MSILSIHGLGHCNSEALNAPAEEGKPFDFLNSGKCFFKAGIFFSKGLFP